MKYKYTVVLLDNKSVCFCDDSGVRVDPISLFYFIHLLGCKVERSSEIVTHTTRLRSFGAVEEGVETIVGQTETNIRYTIVLEA